MSRVVNTAPLIFLAKLDRLELLRFRATEELVARILEEAGEMP